MNATVKAIRHKNVYGKVSAYIEISTSEGKVLIMSGESTLVKLEKIGIKEESEAIEAWGGRGAVHTNNKNKNEVGGGK